MDNLVTFSNNEFGNLRTFEVDGVPWFCAKDILTALDYSESHMTNIAKALDHVPEEWKGRYPIPTPGGVQNLLCVSEQGLYFFVGRSDKKKAIPYQKYVSGEVMPSIRKNGGFIDGQGTLTDEELLSKALLVAQRKIAERDARIKEQEIVIETQANTLEEQKPLVEFANQVGDASNCIDMGQLAKLIHDEGIDIGRNKLFKWLRKKNFLMKNNTPYQKYINDGWFKVVEVTSQTSYGTKTFTKTIVTGKGQIQIVQRFLDEYKDSNHN